MDGDGQAGRIVPVGMRGEEATACAAAPNGHADGPPGPYTCTMDAMDLATQKCVPCEGIGEHLDEAGAARYAELVPSWTREGTTTISRTFSFPNFRDAFGLATRVAMLAEDQGHHPDLHIGWGRLTATLTTHALGGLTVNDFVMAARIDTLAAATNARD
jgi:4a-hydroxytetrahydrobiopterin dehydratase